SPLVGEGRGEGRTLEVPAIRIATMSIQPSTRPFHNSDLPSVTSNNRGIPYRIPFAQFPTQPLIMSRLVKCHNLQVMTAGDYDQSAVPWQPLKPLGKPLPGRQAFR